MNVRTYRFVAPLAVLSLCLISGSAWAQGPRMPQRGQGMPQRNPVAFLERALQNAGAAPLSSTQQQALQSLIQTYRDARKSAGPDPAVQTARQNLDSVILSGDTAGAAAAADALAGALAKDLPATLAAQANFEIQALAVLQPEQVSALEQKTGSAGLLRLLRSLSGGFGLVGAVR